MVKYENFDDFFGANTTLQGNLTPYKGGSVTDIYGWHFYSYLRLTKALSESEKPSDGSRVLEILKTYLKAADNAVKIIGRKCRILEAQGEVIHLIIPSANCVAELSAVKELGKVLTALVDKEILKKDDGVWQFHMAAEWGRAILVAAPSSTKEPSATSCVSLGMCAISPARKMHESADGIARPLWFREYEGEQWHVENCSGEESEVVAKARQDFRQIVAASRNAVLLNMAKPLHGANVEKNKTELVTGFCFRADMDGFTKAVSNALDKGRAAILQFADDFLTYMELANEWQRSASTDDYDITPCAWAGDCFTVMVKPNLSQECAYADPKTACMNLPWDISQNWFSYTKKEQYRQLHRTLDGRVALHWTLSVSYGDIFAVDEVASGRCFRLTSGNPVSVTLTAISLDGNLPDSLVMHKEDVEKLDSVLKMHFHEFERANTEYRYALLTEKRKIEAGKINSVAVLSRRDNTAAKRPEPIRPWCRT